MNRQGISYAGMSRQQEGLDLCRKQINVKKRFVLLKDLQPGEKELEARHPSKGGER